MDKEYWVVTNRSDGQNDKNAGDQVITTLNREGFMKSLQA